MKKFLIPLLLFVVACTQAAPVASNKQVTVGIIDNNEPGFRIETVNPTLAYIQKLLPEYDFHTVEVAAYQATDDINRTKPDFVLAPSDVFLGLINWYGAQAIAVRKNNFATDPGSSVGSTIIVPSNRNDIRTLEDLKGRTVAASLPDSLGGWLALQGELRSHGFDHEKFFKRVDFMTFQLPDVINNVLAGYSDAGVLSACQLEAAEKARLIAQGQFKVINLKKYDGLQCKHSTQLYPDQVFGTLNFSRPELLKQVSIALLSMPDQPLFSWQIAGKFDRISALYRSLELGQWAPRPWTFKALLTRFWKELILLLILLGVLLCNEWRLRHLVQVRTADLNHALEEKNSLLELDLQLRNRIAIMERNSLVSQMSSMIAHELKQPLASIINYTTVIQMRLEGLDVEDPAMDKATTAIGRETNRIVDIVDRVRSYIHKTPSRQSCCDLTQITQKAIQSFGHYAEGATANIRTKLKSSVFVMGDELELEILILNLLKNAAQAVKTVDDATIYVELSDRDGYCTLTVRDNGPTLSEENFQRLTQASESTSPGGLGLGLGIVRSIADAHSANIHIRQLKPRGIAVKVIFECKKELIVHD